MKTKRKTSRSKLTEKPIANSCVFCDKKFEPDYKDVESVSRYVSDRGRIMSRKRSGLCAKHQRRVAIAIKRARHIGLI